LIAAAHRLVFHRVGEEPSRDQDERHRRRELEAVLPSVRPQRLRQTLRVKIPEGRRQEQRQGRADQLERNPRERLKGGGVDGRSGKKRRWGNEGGRR
jgi:hypothetical protein